MKYNTLLNIGHRTLGRVQYIFATYSFGQPSSVIMEMVSVKVLFISMVSRTLEGCVKNRLIKLKGILKDCFQGN